MRAGFRTGVVLDGRHSVSAVTLGRDLRVPASLSGLRGGARPDRAGEGRTFVRVMVARGRRGRGRQGWGGDLMSLAGRQGFRVVLAGARIRVRRPQGVWERSAAGDVGRARPAVGVGASASVSRVRACGRGEARLRACCAGRCGARRTYARALGLRRCRQGRSGPCFLSVCLPLQPGFDGS